MSEAVSGNTDTSSENGEVFVFPASFAQQRLWFLDRLEPGNCAYNLPMGFRIRGPLNVPALKQSLDEIVLRHESLRTTFSLGEDGELQQVVHSHVPFSLPWTNLENQTEALPETEIQQLLAKEASHLFDLSSGPLFRATLVRLSEEEHLLLIVAHHIIIDGWSAGILIRELGRSYQAFTTGRPSPLPPLKIQYRDFAAWQRKHMQGEKWQNLLSFWKKQVGGAATLELPTDRPRPREQTFEGSERSSLIPKPLVDGLRRLARQSSATLFMVLLAAMDTLLYRYTGQEDITVGTALANRNRVELEALIGLFVNTLVLRTDLSGDPTFLELLTRVRETALGAYTHQDMPFEKLVEELKPERNLGHNPLFQVLVNLQNTSDEPPSIPGLSLTPVRVDTGTAKFDLSIGMFERPDGLRVRIAYNTHLFDQTTIERMLGHWEVLLSSILSDPDRRISELSLLSESERQLLCEWNSTEREFYPGCVHECFEQQAATTPDRIAVTYGHQALSYAELNARANQLANYLRKHGVGPGVLAGLLVQRSVEMLVGLLGILKAGGAYVPLDPAYPKERIGFILEDAKAPVLLIQESLLSSLPKSTARMVCLDSDWKAIARESHQNLAPAANSADLAYVIYTSGSTGQPKGVQVEHRNLVNFLTSMQREPGIRAEDTLLAVTTLSFDIAGLELFLPLVMGAQVVIASRQEASDANKLLALLQHSKASVMQATPVTWRMLIEAGWTGSPELKVLCGGEALPADLAAQLLPRCAELWNMYGPTETTIWSSVYRVTSGRTTVPIGRPIANTTFHILDAHLQPVPAGVAGELFIGGEGVVRGYLNRSQLSANKFIADPFSSRAGARLYRTGDLAKRLPDGNVQCLGRTDFQVKLRGFRIELGEIETTLTGHPAIQQAVVILREDVPGEKRLVAYVALRPGLDVSLAALRAHLQFSVPEYMLPSSFVFLSALPLTPNGKINRNALPKPEHHDTADPSQRMAPLDDVEFLLYKIWTKLLGTEAIGVQDNFFNVGGHSLLAVRMVREVQKLTGKNLPLSLLFKGATIEQLAELIQRGEEFPPCPTALEIQAGKGTRPFFAVAPPGANALGYVALARHLGKDQPLYKLQKHALVRPGEPYSPEAFEALAAECVRAMREIQPKGPYHVGGMCEGARIAYDMARLLESQGEEVALLVMLDTWALEHTQIRPLWRLFYYSQRWKRFCRWPWEQKKREILAVLKKKLRRMWATRSSDAAAAGPKYGWTQHYWPENFVPPGYGGNITVFKRAKQPFFYVRDPLLGWGKRTSGAVETVVLHSPHGRILREPYVEEVGKLLLQSLAQLERQEAVKTSSVSVPCPVVCCT